MDSPLVQDEMVVPMANHEKARYNRFLLLVAGLGGLLYGVDVGIIAGALPYLEATSGLNAGQLSIMVAAVLLGSVVSMLIAGLLADLMGRKTLMALSGAVFVLSIPMIALAHCFGPLVHGWSPRRWGCRNGSCNRSSRFSPRNLLFYGLLRSHLYRLHSET